MMHIKIQQGIDQHGVEAMQNGASPIWITFTRITKSSDEELEEALERAKDEAEHLCDIRNVDPSHVRIQWTHSMTVEEFD